MVFLLLSVPDAKPWVFGNGKDQDQTAQKEQSDLESVLSAC